MKAGFDRTLAWALSRNQMFYYAAIVPWCEWYDDPLIYGKIKKQCKIINTSLNIPWKETTDAICFVVDDESSLY